MIISYVTLRATTSGDDTQDIRIRADEVNINPDRVIDRYIEQENEASLQDRPRSRRDALKALVTAYTRLRGIATDASLVISGYFLAGSEWIVVPEKQREGRALMRLFAAQVEHVRDFLQPQYQWLPGETAEQVRTCLQIFMHVTQSFVGVRGNAADYPEHPVPLPSPVVHPRVGSLHLGWMRRGDPNYNLQVALEILHHEIKSLRT